MMMWWVDVSARGGPGAARLLAGFELWAKEVGANVIGGTYTGKTAEPYFVRRGYRRAETRMIKDLT
jgi:hypothetical protein